jgi:hypothetical protein
MRVLAGLAVCGALIANGQIFTSGFEDWNSGFPLHWMGEQTTILIDNVQQVTGDVHSGLYAVRLVQPAIGLTQFTSEPLHLDSGNYYQVGFWAKGSGIIAPALFDDNPWGGILTNPTIQVNSDTWEYHVGEFFCQHTTDIGEVMLTVAITYGPDHLMIDDVSLTLNNPSPPPFLSIQEIQTPLGGSQDSPYVGIEVSTSGIVTAVNTIGDVFFIQNGDGPYSGLRVRQDSGSGLQMGDSVHVTGIVQEIGGAETMLYVTVGSDVLGIERPLPSPVVLALPVSGLEQWEGVLATVENVTCMSVYPDGSWGGTTSGTATPNVNVGTLFISSNVLAGHTYNVTGVQRNGMFSPRLEPRLPEDVTEVVGIAELEPAGLRCYPNPASDVVNVLLPLGSQRPLHYELFDAIGKLVASGFEEGGQVDVTQLSEGLFVLRIEGYTVRLLIRR